MCGHRGICSSEPPFPTWVALMLVFGFMRDRVCWDTYCVVRACGLTRCVCAHARLGMCVNVFFMHMLSLHGRTRRMYHMKEEVLARYPMMCSHDLIQHVIVAMGRSAFTVIRPPGIERAVFYIPEDLQPKEGTMVT